MSSFMKQKIDKNKYAVRLFHKFDYLKCIKRYYVVHFLDNVDNLKIHIVFFFYMAKNFFAKILLHEKHTFMKF